MIEQHGDLWELAKGSVLCITTNGFLKKSGECVMGRGIALQAAKRIPILPMILGELISGHGNHTHLLGIFGDYMLFSYPTKHNWYEKSDLKLIARSAQELVTLRGDNESPVYIPRPGCSNGGLDWEDVKPVIEPILIGERFIVVTNE